MEFGFTDTQEALYDGARAFGQEALAGDAAIDEGAWGQCAAQGLHGLVIGSRYGGQGHDAVTAARILEGLAYGAGASRLLQAVTRQLLTVTKPLERFAANEVHYEALEALVAGQIHAARAHAEAANPGDTAAIQTTAVRDGAGYRVSGCKVVSTHLSGIELAMVTARTGLAPGPEGTTVFLVPTGLDGVTIESRRPHAGSPGEASFTLKLDQCFIPGTHSIGSLHGGDEPLEASLAWERTLGLAPSLGVMSRQLDTATDHARNRVQFGRAISSFEAVSHRLARMAIRLDAARLLLYRAAWAADHGEARSRADAVSNAYVSEAVIESHVDMLRVLGAAGYLGGSAVEETLLGSLNSALGPGSHGAQHNLIASRLGVEREE